MIVRTPPQSDAQRGSVYIVVRSGAATSIGVCAIPAVPDFTSRKLLTFFTGARVVRIPLPGSVELSLNPTTVMTGGAALTLKARPW